MNRKTLPQSIVDEAIEEDKAAALAEYMGQFRDDVAAYIDRSIVESCVKKGRKQLMPNSNFTYCSFADLSGGRHDDGALAIAHKKDRIVIVDYLLRIKAPFDPLAAIKQMAAVLKRYKLSQVTADSYAAEYQTSTFRQFGITCKKSEKNKSELYLEMLPCLCSHEIELLDDEMMIDQICNLERRTRSGGKDLVDHPSGCHDDVANVVAGVTAITTKRKRKAGSLFHNRNRRIGA